MHEYNFLSSWFREDGREKEERREKVCEKPGDWSEFESDSRVEVRVVSVVTDLSSVVTEFCDGFSCCSDWEFVEPQSFSFSKKRAHCCTSTQEEMRYESSQVKAPPLSRRRMMPHTPLQNSNGTFEEEQGRFVMEDQMWSARERTFMARTKQYLEESYSVKVEVEEVEGLLGPDDVDGDFRRIQKEARDEKGCFSTDGLTEFLVASRSRCGKWNAPWRQNSPASASEGWW